jgi:hypothetical protein
LAGRRLPSVPRSVSLTTANCRRWSERSELGARPRVRTGRRQENRILPFGLSSLMGNSKTSAKSPYSAHLRSAAAEDSLSQRVSEVPVFLHFFTFRQLDIICRTVILSYTLG